MSNWLIYYLLFIFVFWMLFSNRKQTEKYIEAKIKRRNGDKDMQELAKRFIGKDVLINTVASGTIDGILKEVVDNAVVIDRNGAESVVNLDYVTYAHNSGIRRRIYGKSALYMPYCPLMDCYFYTSANGE